MTALTKWEETSIYLKCERNLPGIDLLASNGDSYAEVLAIAKEWDGQISFVEMQDVWNYITMPKEDAIKALEEAIAWIKAE